MSPYHFATLVLFSALLLHSIWIIRFYILLADFTDLKEQLGRQDKAFKELRVGAVLQDDVNGFKRTGAEGQRRRLLGTHIAGSAGSHMGSIKDNTKVLGR